MHEPGLCLAVQRRVFFEERVVTDIRTEDVDRVMQALPPQARIALDVLSQSQQRPVEDVLRDEIAKYIEGRLPSIDIEGAMSALKATAYQAGFIIGRLRRFSREFGTDDE